MRHSQDVCFTGHKKIGTAEQEGTLGAEIWKVMERGLVEESS